MTLTNGMSSSRAARVGGGSDRDVCSWSWRRASIVAGIGGPIVLAALRRR